MTRTVVYQIGRVYVAVYIAVLSALRYTPLRSAWVIRLPRRELDRYDIYMCVCVCVFKYFHVSYCVLLAFNIMSVIYSSVAYTPCPNSL